MRKEEELILKELRGTSDSILTVFLQIIRHLKEDLNTKDKEKQAEKQALSDANKLLSNIDIKSSKKDSKQSYFSIRELAE